MSNPGGTSTRGPVFVVGMNGSGTTMLADSLGRHPGLYMLPLESKVLPYYLGRFGAAGQLDSLAARRQLADRIGGTKAFWQSNGKQPLKVPDEALEAEGFAGVLDALYGTLATAQGKRRWGDKSPINTWCVQALADAIPEARFIHIVRDGRDAAQSFHRRWGYEPRHTIWRWRDAVTTASEAGQRLGPARYVELRYEALTAQPETHMRALCDFLGLPFDRAVLESSMRYMDPANEQAGQGRIIENSGKWATYFSAADIASLERIAGRCLAEHGYAVSDGGGEAVPSPLRRRWWRFRDAVMFTASFFREYGWRGIGMYGRLGANALRQRIARKT